MPSAPTCDNYMTCQSNLNAALNLTNPQPWFYPEEFRSKVVECWLTSESLVLNCGRVSGGAVLSEARSARVKDCVQVSRLRSNSLLKPIASPWVVQCKKCIA